ncbi:MAG: peptidoglycan DD-metalloendopeptidase family protein [Candidatus Eiseniibacteriota bacterium]
MIRQSWRLLVFCAAFAAVLSGCRQDAVERIAPHPERIVQVLPPPPPPTDRREVEIRRGEPLDGAMHRLGLSAAERWVVGAAFGEKVDLRRVLPGERLEVQRDASGRLVRAALHRDELQKVEMELPESGPPAVAVVRHEPEVQVRCVVGELHGSLYESVLAEGGDADLVNRFADILSWQVDFVTEPREGDRFRILAERRSFEGKDLGFGEILAAEYDGDCVEGRAVRWSGESEKAGWYDDRGESVHRAFLKSPLNYSRISSGFSRARRHPVLKKVMPHWGVDYAAPRGTPVSALGDGTVEFAGMNRGLGNYVEVRHNSTYTTCYGHLDRIAKGVRRGARVEQGQVIGTVGSTGLSTGPHLDFRVKRGGSFIDPLRLESPPGRALLAEEQERFARWRDRVWVLADRIEPGEELAWDEAWARVPPDGAPRELLALAP